MIPVAFDLRDPVRSGIARVATSLAESFTRNAGSDFSVSLAGPEAALKGIGAQDWNGGRVKLVPWTAGRYSPGAELSWRRVRDAAGPALWYFPHWDVPWSAGGVDFIATVHDLGHLVPRHVSTARRLIARRWIARTVHRARRLTVVSGFTGQTLAAAFPESSGKTELLPNGVDDSFFGPAQPLPDSVRRLVAERPFMLSVGNLKTYKNLNVGLDVLAAVPQLEWIVVGEWFPDWAETEARARHLNVHSRVHVLGRQPDTTLKALYDHAACLLFPSRHEGFGLPIVEAMAAGTPVVASNAPACVETLGDAGVVCAMDDPGAFVRAVSAVVAEGRSAGRRGPTRAREFSWSRSASRLARMFESVHAHA